MANNITMSQLLSWNPTIDPKCVNFDQKIGHVICLSSPAGYTPPNITAIGTAPTPATTPAPVPTDAMTGSNIDCGAWYLMQPNDQCALIATKNGITLNDFYFLNPEINANCTNLWANASYCVEAVGDITTYPGYYGNTTTTTIVFQTDPSLTWTALPTATAPSYSNVTAAGYPVANGSLVGCFEMFQNSYGSLTCDDAADLFGVSVDNWIRWNPSVLPAGTNYSLMTCVLANETQYCGSFYNQSLVPPSVISYAPVPVDATANATTQCLEWYFAVSGDSCDSICQEYDMPYWAFQEWNPALGSACNLLANTSYCVWGPDGDEVYYGETSTATITGGPPGPTQTGIVSGCTEWYLAQAGDECGYIAGNYSISLAQFYAWNPAVGSSCQYLVPGDAYCVSDPTTLPTSTTATAMTTSVTPPGPTQSGIPNNCNAYALSQSGDGCDAFATRNGITLANLC